MQMVWGKPSRDLAGAQCEMEAYLCFRRKGGGEMIAENTLNYCGENFETPSPSGIWILFNNKLFLVSDKKPLSTEPWF